MVLGVGARADVCLDGRVVVARHRVHHVAAVRRERARFEYPLLDFHAFDEHLDVVRVIEKIRIDHRRLARIAAGDADAAAALRPQQVDVAAEAVAQVQLAAVIVDNPHHENQLQVGVRDLRRLRMKAPDSA